MGTIPWARVPQIQATAPLMNAAIEEIYRERPAVVRGPDLYAFFQANQHLISGDNLHPSAEGYAAYRQQWADAMLATVYNAAPLPSPTPATATPTTAPAPTATPTSAPSATSSATATPAPTAGDGLVLYDNAVRNGFWDGSFSYSSRNPCDASAYTSAGCSYAIAYNAWGGINFGQEGGFSTAGYRALEYTIKTSGQPITHFGVTLGAYPGGATIRQLTLAPSHIVATLPGGWVRVSVPVNQLNPDNVAAYTVQLKNATSGSLPTIHVDDVRFTATSTSPSPTTPTATPVTPTATPVVPTPTATPVVPTPTPAPGEAFVLYDDALQGGFRDWSYTLTSRTTCDRSTYAGGACSYAVAYGGWGGVKFQAPDGGLDTRPYERLEWAVNTHGLPLSNFAVVLVGVDGRALGQQITLSETYVTEQLAGGWVRVAVPVAQLNPAQAPVMSIHLRNTTAKALPTIHLDDIRFLIPPAR